MRWTHALSFGSVVLLAACSDLQQTPAEVELAALQEVSAAAAGTNLDQYANGTPTTPAEWQNGNLNGNNSEFFERSVVPFRLAVEGLAPGWHEIHVNYDFTAGGRLAYDFLASVNATDGPATNTAPYYDWLCETGGGGVSSLCAAAGGLGAAGVATAVWPRDPFSVTNGPATRVVGGGPGGHTEGASPPTAVEDSGLEDALRELRVYGALNVEFVQQGGVNYAHSGPTDGNNKSDIIVRFEVPAGGDAVLLAWGGHLSCSWCWFKRLGGNFNGAAQISGAPWHMRTQNLDGGGASNQDRSIQPSALLEPVTIDGYKYLDTNQNGVWDTGEPPLEGWTINLYEFGSVYNGFFGSVVTDANGYYIFELVPPGSTYEVEEECPDGFWVQSEPAQTATCGDARHTVPTTGPAVPGTTYSNNFGNYATALKSGVKFHDLNANGSRDAGEPGIAGWTVDLLDGTGAVVDTDVTDATGTYQFQVVAGVDLLVCEALPDGWIQSFPATGAACATGYGPFGYAINLAPGESDLDNDFGNYQMARKEGMKFEDLDANGAFDAGEPGIEGWQIDLLDGTGAVVQTTVTNAAGMYEFDVMPGVDYLVCEAPLTTDWIQSVPTAGASCPASYAPLGYAINLVSGEVETGNDFGNYLMATKSGMKFEDVNANGAYDSGVDQPLPGWEIYLIDGTGAAAVTTTDAAGDYSFNVMPGVDYLVCEAAGAGWAQSYPLTGADCPTGYAPLGYAINLLSGEVESGNDFGNYQSSTKEGMKFHDLNANGVMDGGEPGLPGWTIYVDVDADGYDAEDPQAVTAADGTYSISGIMPGTYRVYEVAQDGWTCSMPTDTDAFGCYYEDTFTSGETVPNNNFGNWTTATKEGMKFHDLNADGVKDGGEPGLPGWTIYVDVDADGYDAEDPQAVTADDGTYSISGIMPGTYRVYEVAQDGWTCSMPTDSDAFGCYYEEVFASAATLTGNDFGNWTTATKEGMKFHDLNADGVKDGGEPGLPGWTIYVDVDADGYDAEDPQAITAADGSYTISGIMPGTYRIYEVGQADWTCSYPSDTDAFGCYYEETFTSGINLPNNDFGNWTTASKSGVKFHDLDGDGAAREAGEPGLSGFTIRIYSDVDGDGTLSAGDQLVNAQTTGTDGSYSFTGLVPGKYIVCEVTMPGYLLSYPNNGICQNGLALFGELHEWGGYAIELASGEDEVGNDFGNTGEVFGCTPGYWKNHTDRWVGYADDDLLGDVFGPTGDYDGSTLYEALRFKGGGGAKGATRILFRAAVASLLNFSHTDVAFTVPDAGSLPAITSEADLKSAVVAAIASGNRRTMLALATQLDDANNAVNLCPLGGSRAFRPN